MIPSITMSNPIAIPTSLEHVQNTAGDTLSPNNQDIIILYYDIMIL